MAIQNRQWISIDEAIKAFMVKADGSNKDYFKLWHIAFEGLHDMGLDAFHVVKSVKLPVNANLTATLPADYLMYSKIGVLNQQGEIIPMGINNKLTVAFDLNPTRLEQTQDNTLQTQFDENGVMWYNYWNGGGYGNLYGLPSGSPFIGSYKIDNANGVIVLSENFTYPYVMLEYTASPVEGGEYYIPIQFRTALVAYLGWQAIVYIPVKTHVANSNVQMRRHDYYNERRLAIARYDPIHLPDLYEWNLQTMRLAVKA